MMKRADNHLDLRNINQERQIEYSSIHVRALERRVLTYISRVTHFQNSMMMELRFLRRDKCTVACTSAWTALSSFCF